MKIVTFCRSLLKLFLYLSKEKNSHEERTKTIQCFWCKLMKSTQVKKLMKSTVCIEIQVRMHVGENHDIQA
jgi:hypothetical protein